MIIFISLNLNFFWLHAIRVIRHFFVLANFLFGHPGGLWRGLNPSQHPPPPSLMNLTAPELQYQCMINFLLALKVKRQSSSYMYYGCRTFVTRTFVTRTFVTRTFVTWPFVTTFL